ncbi:MULTISPECIES: division/cell wall cluster transcriptional repressor MraZ [Prosthecochloris]|uniref:Transcriptional regulator MraZ n=1 Tax=Prosthecochloris vibrioformis TaxID=1098 RepID=A0A5C4S3C1_PROVB|nr:MULTISPECIES: division/cell wall cluster transcriptional repressor MraZ [Prosthecochloris]ANT66010.1 cell division protein MraZ [Prosthecochloris sp. CIB 2401]TNJ37668.1 division/cell wall cluster transcriptional repressor MraZ [Prosthecochloris vibrioformis]
MPGFIGKELHAIDDKGRLMIPARFRKRLSGSESASRKPHNLLYVMKVPDGSLELYESMVWQEKERSLMALSDFNPDEHLLKTLLYERLDCVDIDRQGRIALSREFLDHAAISREVVIVGANIKMILWEPGRLERVVRENSSRVQVLASRYF